MKIAVSFIKSKYNEKETIDEINKTSADYVHVDIMDGIFVENKNYDIEDIRLFTKDNQKPLDVHLMVDNPEEYINEYIPLRPDTITFHIEAIRNPERLINLIHDNNIKCGLAINPDTDIKEVIPYLDLVENILIMTVYPGAGGQAFIPEMSKKIDELAKLKGNFTIEVDGGINKDTLSYVTNADILVSGSYVCLSDNYEEKISSLK